MLDRNITLVLVGGEKVDVVYPDCIGSERETPLLERKGCREWNIDVGECLDRPRSGNPRFIIGKWGTMYGESEGVKRVIPFGSVSNWMQLSPELLAVVDKNMKDELDRRAAEALADPERVIKLKDILPLIRRIADLESAVASIPGSDQQ